jgi:SAM-dependent methyltransferase
MTLLDRVHGGYVHARRVRVLASRLAQLMPHGARVLDVGAGDGRLSSEILGSRPDLQIRGIDPLVRDNTHIPVELFDGRRVPHADDSFDVVMFVDVLHHTDDPAALLGEAVRVARRAVVIKDHLLTGLFAGPTLTLMDWVGNARHGVELPNNYWPEERWRATFDRLGVRVAAWQTDLPIYPWPASLVFGRSMHFVAKLDLADSQTS